MRHVYVACSYMNTRMYVHPPPPQGLEFNVGEESGRNTVHNHTSALMNVSNCDRLHKVESVNSSMEWEEAHEPLNQLRSFEQ